MSLAIVLENYFHDYKISWQLFSLSTLLLLQFFWFSLLLHRIQLLVLIMIPLYVISVFYLAAFKIFSLTSLFCSFTWCVWAWISYNLSWFRFLNLRVDVFHEFWKSISYYFFEYFFSPVLLFFLLELPIDIYWACLLTLSSISYNLCFLFFSFSLCAAL